VLAEPKGSTSPKSQPHRCTLFRRIYISLPCRMQVPWDVTKKKSNLAQTNYLEPLVPNPATDQDPEPVPTCFTKNIFTIYFLWRNSP